MDLLWWASLFLDTICSSGSVFCGKLDLNCLAELLVSSVLCFSLERIECPDNLWCLK